MKKPSAIKLFKLLVLWGGILLPCLLVLGIFVCIEIIAYNHNRAVDLTPAKVYSLSEQAQQVLKSLDDKVVMKTFYPTGDRSKYATFYEILRSYSSKIEYQLIDIERNPGKARMYRATSPGFTIVEYKGRTHIINPPTEETVVNAILRLSGISNKTFYVLKGHGERRDIDKLKSLLDRENWKVNSAGLDDMNASGIPKNAVLMVAGPRNDFTRDETALFDRYLKNGGKAIVLLEPFVDLPNLEKLLESYRIQLPDAIIIDHKSKLFGGDDLAPLIPHYANAPITSQMRTASFFSTARPVDVVRSGGDPDISVMALATSEDYSWAKGSRDDVINGRIDYIEGTDMPGPLFVGVMATVAGKKENGGPKPTELICFGDSDFISDSFLEVMGNTDLFLNSVEWLARDYDLISVRGKRLRHHYGFLSHGQGQMLFQVSVIILPLIFLFVAIVLGIYRRMRG